MLQYAPVRRRLLEHPSRRETSPRSLRHEGVGSPRQSAFTVNRTNFESGTLGPRVAKLPRRPKLASNRGIIQPNCRQFLCKRARSGARKREVASNLAGAASRSRPVKRCALPKHELGREASGAPAARLSSLARGSPSRVTTQDHTRRRPREGGPLCI